MLGILNCLEKSHGIKLTKFSAIFFTLEINILKITLVHKNAAMSSI